MNELVMIVMHRGIDMAITGSQACVMVKTTRFRAMTGLNWWRA